MMRTTTMMMINVVWPGSSHEKHITRHRFLMLNNDGKIMTQNLIIMLVNQSKYSQTRTTLQK